MRSLEAWLTEYGKDHRNSTNQMIHKVCVPLIMMSLFGLLWAIPTPEFFSGLPYLNWATLFCVLCLFFYSSLSCVFAGAMLVLALAMLTIVSVIASTSYLVPISVGVFVVAWIGQFVGHKIEGQKPSFLTDLQFLLIGPLWVIKGFFPSTRNL